MKSMAYDTESFTKLNIYLTIDISQIFGKHIDLSYQKYVVEAKPLKKISYYFCKIKKSPITCIKITP